jgi:hypothetical protein
MADVGSNTFGELALCCFEISFSCHQIAYRSKEALKEITYRATEALQERYVDRTHICMAWALGKVSFVLESEGQLREASIMVHRANALQERCRVINHPLPKMMQLSGAEAQTGDAC